MKDFILDNSNDLATSEGDFLIDVPDLQNVSLLLSTTKGDWKDRQLLVLDLYVTSIVLSLRPKG